MENFGCSSNSLRPQFFKQIFHPDDLFKLKVPSEFMKSITDRNNDCIATLFGPLSKLCHVELYQNESETFFGNGWQEFSKFHDIGVGSVLVFRYEGNSLFTVKIFDSNQCLKDFESTSSQVQTKPGFDIPEEEDRSPRTGTKVVSSSEVKMKRMSSPTVVNSIKKKRNSCPVTHEAIMKEYSVYNYMPFPKIFGSSSEKSLKQGIVVVKNENKKSWSVNFKECARYNCLCGGWRKFCRENEIQIGDACKFVVEGKNEIQVFVSKPIIW